MKATEQLANDTARRIERRQLGYTDPAEEQARRPLAEHLKDYAAHLEAKGNTPKHTRDSLARCKAVFAGCEFVFPLDADAGRVSEWLVNRRRDGSPIELPDGVDAFRPSEAAKLLGISLQALARAVERNGLPAAGNGKARHIPRATVEALVVNKAKGAGPETINHYIRAVCGFFRWLVKARRIGSNPLESLTLVNAAADVRRARRELTADELRRLFDAARASARTYR